jgi:hypothetical protein
MQDKFRVVIHMTVSAKINNGSITFKSAPIVGKIEACEVLTTAMEHPDATGGGLEVHIDGVGWVIGDEVVEE